MTTQKIEEGRAEWKKGHGPPNPYSHWTAFLLAVVLDMSRRIDQLEGNLK